MLLKIPCKVYRGRAFYSCKAEGPRANKPSKIDKGKAEGNRVGTDEGFAGKGYRPQASLVTPERGLGKEHLSRRKRNKVIPKPA